MMIYPSAAGIMYLHLGKVTKNDKYIKESIKIADYYKNTIEENGSWYLVRSTVTGEPTVQNYIAPMEQVVPFLMEIYEETKDDSYKEICGRAMNYVINNQMKNYNWEGQFEDIMPSCNYMNLTHYSPVAIAKYYAQYHKDNTEYMETAKELIRFAEDQFIVWNRPNPWDYNWYAAWDETIDDTKDIPKWTTPCALEQYSWHVPIDASAANFIFGFLAMYEAGCGELYLAKAKALADQITRIQHENGMIPTHWMNTEGADSNFWYNCLFFTCSALEKISKYDQ